MSAALGYCRVSSSGQASSGLGLDGQDQQIHDYHARVLQPRGIPLRQVFVDPGVSASKCAFLDRPEGMAISSIASSGDHLLFAKMDRCFRNLADYAISLQRWTANGIFVHILNTGLDTSDPKQLASAKMVSGIFATFAEYEAQMIGQRKRDANVVARQSGRPTNGSIPPGFKLSGPPRFRKLVPDPAQQDVIQRIVVMRDAGMGFGEIAARLQAERVTWRKADRTAPRGFTMELWCRHRVKRAYEAARHGIP